MNSSYSCKISFRRFRYLLRWLLSVEFRTLRNLFLVAVGVFWLTHTMLMIDALQDVAEGQRAPFVSIEQLSIISLFHLCILMCIGISMGFTTLHHRHRGRQLLLLPAGNASKFLALWLLYVPLLLVLFSVAFIVADVLRMCTLPLLHSEGHLPSAIPAFFQWMGYFLTLSVPYGYDVFEVWTYLLFTHSLCLCCGVLCGALSIFLSGIVLYLLAFLLGVLMLPHEVVAVLFIPLFAWAAYWLFCRYPSIRITFFKHLINGLSFR